MVGRASRALHVRRAGLGVAAGRTRLARDDVAGRRGAHRVAHDAWIRHEKTGNLGLVHLVYENSRYHRPRLANANAGAGMRQQGAIRAAARIYQLAGMEGPDEPSPPYPM